MKLNTKVVKVNKSDVQNFVSENRYRHLGRNTKRALKTLVRTKEKLLGKHYSVGLLDSVNGCSRRSPSSFERQRDYDSYSHGFTNGLKLSRVLN